MKYMSKAAYRKAEAKAVTMERIGLAVLILIGLVIAYTHGIH